MGHFASLKYNFGGKERFQNTSSASWKAKVLEGLKQQIFDSCPNFLGVLQVQDIQYQLSHQRSLSIKYNVDSICGG